MRPPASALYYVQRLYPWVLGVAGGATMWAVVKADPTSSLKNIKELLSAALSIDAIVVGFVATAKSIIVSMDGRRPVENAKRKRSWNMIIGYTSAAVHVSVIGMALSAALLVADLSNPGPAHRVLVALWMGLLVTTVAAYHRVALALGHLLKALDTTRQPEGRRVPERTPPAEDDELPFA